MGLRMTSLAWLQGFGMGKMGLEVNGRGVGERKKLEWRGDTKRREIK